MKFWIAKDNDGDVYMYDKCPIKGSYSYTAANDCFEYSLLDEFIPDTILGRTLDLMEVVEVDASECFHRPISDSKSDLYPNGQLSSGKRKKHH